MVERAPQTATDNVLAGKLRILTDEPASDDALDFKTYSEVLAQIIRNSAPRFTIGVFGPWGAGKTTLMRMIEEKISGDAKILKVSFNAWRFEREENLALIPLLKTIEGSLEGNKDFKTLRTALRITVNALAEAGKAKVGIDFRSLPKRTKSLLGLDSSRKTLYYDALQELKKELTKLVGNGMRLPTFRLEAVSFEIRSKIVWTK